MNVFFDSSALLSIVFDEPASVHAIEIMEASKLRFGSFLLRIETLQSVNRNFLNKETKRNQLLNYAGDILSEFELFSWNETCETELQNNKFLYPLKSLDAMQLSSFLSLRKEDGLKDLKLVSFDDRMLKVAKSLNVPIISPLRKK